MTNPMIKIHDTRNNMVEEREMNADELKQWEADKAEAQARLAAGTEMAADKAALLAKLGITADELKTLLN